MPKILPFLLLGLSAVLTPSCQSTTALDLAAEGGERWQGPQAGLLQPFKERSFAYRRPLQVRDGGNYLLVPYDEWKDINERDEIPVRKVHSRFIRRLPPGAERELEYEGANGVLKYHAVGKLDGDSAMTVIYLHGRGGNRHWGFDDERFGGNFNRLKNMLLQAGGAYISPDFTDFDSAGFADVKRLVARYRPLTRGKLVVACGSLGNSHCWNIFHDQQTAAKVDGVVVLAGFPDPRLASGRGFGAGRKIALMIAHGTADPDYNYRPMEELYHRLRRERPDYPLRLILFDTGKHGAPVRMIDWRDTLNWIASIR